MSTQQASFIPSSVTLKPGEKVGISVRLPAGREIVRIDTPEFIEGWPVDLINSQRWGSVNAVSPGIGEIVFTLDDGTVARLPIAVLAVPVTNAVIENGMFVLDVYMPNTPPWNGEHFHGEAELKRVE